MAASSSSDTFNLLWLQAASCGGCTMSALAADDTELLRSLERFGIRMLWHPSLSEESGTEALSILEDCASGRVRLDCLCVEGSVLLGPQGSGRFQMLSGSGKPMMEWISRLAAQASTVVAVGSCAAFGGVPAAGHNPTDARGLQYSGWDLGGALGKTFRSGSGLPVVNIAGCAPHPGWMVETLAALALGNISAEHLDALGRPRTYADHLAHHGCGRNEFYEFKASAARPSDRGCLMENLGCRATQAPGDCNIRRWNGYGSCTDGGYACINCTSPCFETPSGPFQETAKVAGIPVGLPVDMPKAWFVALAALSKSATPQRVRTNAHADHVIVPPARKPFKSP
ncbi:Hydrogen-sensing hydrogenase small subunit (HoxB/HupU) [Paramagnetospirillum magnetotacticum MS-1]|uniref:hydrogenase (acceptor) n=1 Tax=Paramagnetospirillum magnetotacticum MS-1 TaxID=272627 RepID=A0A0C2YZ40_PARME|nr:Ni,Fe-hydrogenase I small subunit [Paramagnetospirillum magnetotacticum]KIM00359.1 Hydrogen-sensing hydrogenase small subunit (HoxB/HupU) [Paramagnetospirillum magnetotacticum MS-1]